MADRILFSKFGRARFISHLDLMRTIQRAFFRAGIQIKHTEGYNPHPFVSIALPLSVGYSSDCEIMEFVLLGGASYEDLPEKMNAVLPEGVSVQACYPAENKLKELAYLNCIVRMDYDNGVPEAAEAAWRELLSRESLVVKKKSNKSKLGYTETDIIPLIHRWTLTAEEKDIRLDMILSAQNPGLNPVVIRDAFCEAYPELPPDFMAVHRKEALDINEKPFR